MKVLSFPLDSVVTDLRAREWCKLPYPNHPKGCPNYGKKTSCPPKAPLFESFVKAPFTLVGVGFNLAEWAKAMKEKHPKWSDRQARCCLYWQGKVRKKLREVCNRMALDNELIVYAPEAMGVHVFKTCEKVGLKLERNPQDFVWKIAIIGRDNNQSSSVNFQRRLLEAEK